jgi:hypothetical protein
VAALNVRMSLLGATFSLPGERAENLRPSVAAYNSQAVDAYQQYIDAWEASGRNFLKFSSGADALTNQATVYRKLGRVSNRDAAIPNVNASMNASRPSIAPTIAPTGASFSRPGWWCR